MIFIVLRHGLHIRTVCGAYTTADAAIARAQQCAVEARDAYHDFVVSEVALDAPEPCEKIIFAMNKDGDRIGAYPS